MSGSQDPRKSGVEVAEADQLRAAWWAGFDCAADGGSRTADPHVHGDRDLHLAWDEGWLAGSGITVTTDHRVRPCADGSGWHYTGRTDNDRLVAVGRCAGHAPHPTREDAERCAEEVRR